MKILTKSFAIILCVCLCVVLLSGCGSSQDDLDAAWEDGYDEGYYCGWGEGYEEGYLEAESEYEDDYIEGYNDGNNDGYYSGATYTCLFFGDIERAFECAKKGRAWYALIDAYDQYEYDIYDEDDKETRSQLFWALVSYTSEDGATKEEYNLLYSAFSTDLYYLD